MIYHVIYRRSSEVVHWTPPWKPCAYTSAWIHPWHDLFFVLCCYQTLLSQAAIEEIKYWHRHTSNLEELTDGKVVYHVKGLAGHVQVLFHLRTHHGCIAMWDLAIIHGSMHENPYPSNQIPNSAWGGTKHVATNCKLDSWPKISCGWNQSKVCEQFQAKLSNDTLVFRRLHHLLGWQLLLLQIYHYAEGTQQKTSKPS